MKVTVISGADSKELDLDSGLELKRTLQQSGLLNMPCGNGRCGKCRVRVLSAPLPEPSVEEEGFLSRGELEAGVRLLCSLARSPRFDSPLRLEILPKDAPYALTAFATSEFTLCPVVRALPFEAPPPSLKDQRSDLKRCLDACGLASHAFALEQLEKLPLFLRDNAFSGHVLEQGGTALAYCSHPSWRALVVDIGTTTISALLADTQTGQVLEALGQDNPQAAFGADVLSRIAWSMEHPGPELANAVRGRINDLLQSLLHAQGLEDVDSIVCTGNSTMLHLLLNLPAASIGRAPFVSAVMEPLRFLAADIGIASQARLFLPPAISSFVGADTVCALLAALADAKGKNFLLVDIGTNAETALFFNGGFWACAAAAGPCFEGVSLSCGMPGAPGAIDRVFRTAEAFAHTSIGNIPARGLCGSGVVDSLALLLETGALDATGRMRCEGPLAGYIENEDGRLRFAVAPGVYLSQRDMREVQLAKAALRAGIDVLLAEAGVSVDALDKVYLAGGFGSFLNPASAARLGMLPAACEGKLAVLGNAASHGALRYLLARGDFERAREIAAVTHYVELSTHVGFSGAYMERMTLQRD